ncbi:MAG: deoxynucleoside kinase [Candidatus Gracilibacteria bacterium]|nr:deoxynucleoside kinase [Candidatus Gracilibacteria bacterium]
MFIVIEGIDGSGKGTQTILLKEKLEILGKKVKIIDYPRYGKKGAFFVEKYLNGEYGKDVNYKTASLFYALDRYDSSIDIKKYLIEYDYVISNRYTTSNMIHQSGKIIKEFEDKTVQKKELKIFLDWLIDMEYNILSIPKPDKVIFLDVKPEVAIKLIEKKEKREYIKGDKNKDIHEEDDKHLENAYKIAKKIAKKYDWKTIKCTENKKILDKSSITNLILKNIIN